jgi:hypothetical protein
MDSRRWAVGLGGVCLLVACRSHSATAPSGPQFHLTIRSAAYAPGSVAQGALYNDGAVAIADYSFCSGSVEERAVSGAWTAVSGWAFPCALLFDTLAAGDSVAWSISLPPTLTAGTYRLRFLGVPSYALADDDARSRTPPFTVVGPAAAGR